MVSEETTSICSHCNRSIPSLNIDLHYAHCSRNLEKCVVCGDMIPRKHAEEHYQSTHAPDTCGNRTESCQRCGRYIRLRDRYVHETTCNGIADNAVGSSSREVRPVPERDAGPQRRVPPPYPRSRLFFTIAVTGFAFILGSFFLQKKSDSSPVPQ